MKLSIIIPCYNVENYLAKCVNSVLNNKIEDKYEIILVNDGSTDNTLEIKEEYQKNKTGLNAEDIFVEAGKLLYKEHSKYRKKHKKTGEKLKENELEENKQMKKKKCC